MHQLLNVNVLLRHLRPLQRISTSRDEYTTGMYSQIRKRSKSCKSIYARELLIELSSFATPKMAVNHNIYVLQWVWNTCDEDNARMPYRATLDSFEYIQRHITACIATAIGIQLFASKEDSRKLIKLRHMKIRPDFQLCYPGHPVRRPNRFT